MAISRAAKVPVTVTLPAGKARVMVIPRAKVLAREINPVVTATVDLVFQESVASIRSVRGMNPCRFLGALFATVGFAAVSLAAPDEPEIPWSFSKLVRPGVPEMEGASWPRDDLDFFIADRLKAEGLRPSPDADRRTLIRRAALDLTGLPPTLEEIDDFLRNPATDETRLRERWSMAISPASASANAGAGTGSMSRVTRTVSAEPGMLPLSTPGGIATG